jgi:hypothetical protein
MRAARCVSSTDRQYINAFRYYTGHDTYGTSPVYEYTDTNYDKVITHSSSGYYLHHIQVRNNYNRWGSITTGAKGIRVAVPVSGTAAVLDEGNSRIIISWNSQTYDADANVGYKVYIKAWEEGTSEPGGWTYSQVYWPTDAPTGTRTVYSTSVSGFTLTNNYKYIVKVHSIVMAGSNYIESNDSGTPPFVYYLQNAPKATILTDDTSSGISQVEDDYTINTTWKDPGDAGTYGANAATYTINYDIKVYYSATNPVPTTRVYNFTTSWDTTGVDHGVIVTTEDNGYYAVEIYYDQSHTASYGAANYTNGETDVYCDKFYSRVSTGWQGVINKKTNPSSINNIGFLDIGGDVGGVDDRNLNDSGNEAY